MNANLSVVKGKVIAVAAAAALALATAGSALAAPGGGGGGGHAGGGGGFHGGGGGFHGGGYGGYRGGYGGRGYYGGGRYYGGYRGGYGWRGGGCCGWGWGWGLGLGVGLGWGLAALPYGYSTYWWGGVPYYYANNNYYLWDSSANSYEAVEPPSGLTSTPSPGGAQGGNAPAMTSGPAGTWTDLYAYPKGGQSMEQQTKDRDECHKWAVGQTGYDPAQPAPTDSQDLMVKRQGYLRAEGACLEARNYSVK
jgi:hypothetical protein